MEHGAEFLGSDGLWYGWDNDSSGYWAWSDAAEDWLEFDPATVTAAPAEEEAAVEAAVSEPVAAAVPETVEAPVPEEEPTPAPEPDETPSPEPDETPAPTPVAAAEAVEDDEEATPAEEPAGECSPNGLYYVTSEETYYYLGGLLEFDADWEAYYYYNDPNDPEQYEWLPEELSGLEPCMEVADKAAMDAARVHEKQKSNMEDGFHSKQADAWITQCKAEALEEDAMPDELKRAVSLDIDDENTPPELYFDQQAENYFWKGLQVHYKKKTNVYYVKDLLREETVTLPEEHHASIANGDVVVWNSVATTGISKPDAANENEQPLPEIAAVNPEANKKPLVFRGAIPSGSLFEIKENDLQIFTSGATNLVSQAHPSLHNEALIEHFQMSRWGEYLVGRCRRTFSTLVNKEVTVESIASRLRELTGLVQHLNEVQLLSIWSHNAQETKWAQAPENDIREFAFKIERAVPFIVFVRCLMRGFDKEEGSTAYYVKKYYPKETNRAGCVEKAQEYMKEFDQHTSKNMGRTIIMIHGCIELEPRLRSHLVADPWWILPTVKDSSTEVYYNSNTLEAYTSNDRKKPANALKLQCVFKDHKQESIGVHVCKA